MFVLLPIFPYFSRKCDSHLIFSSLLFIYLAAVSYTQDRPKPRRTGYVWPCFDFVQPNCCFICVIHFQKQISFFFFTSFMPLSTLWQVHLQHLFRKVKSLYTVLLQWLVCLSGCSEPRGVKTGASAPRIYMDTRYAQTYTFTHRRVWHVHTQSRCGSRDAHAAAVSPPSVRWASGNPEWQLVVCGTLSRSVKGRTSGLPPRCGRRNTHTWCGRRPQLLKCQKEGASAPRRVTGLVKLPGMEGQVGLSRFDSCCQGR